MNVIEALEKIRALFATQENKVEEPKEFDFSTAILKDGTTISYDSLEPEQVVSKVLEDGTTEDLPAGDYELEDGKLIVIGEGSKIVEVKEPEAEADEEMANEEPAVGEDTKMAEVESRLSKIEEALQIILETISSQNDTMSSIKEDFSSKIEELSNEPAVQPIHYGSTKEKEETVFEQRLRALDALKK